LFGFAEKDAKGGGFAGEGGGKWGGVGDFGDVGTAGLLGGFEGDTSPAGYPLFGGEGEVFFRAAGEDGGDAGHAELGGFLDRPLEVIEFEDGEQQMDWQGGVGLEFFVEGEGNFGVGHGGDFGAVEEAVGDHVKDLAGLGAEDAREVVGLLARNRGMGGLAGFGGPGVGDPAAAHRAAISG